MLSLLCLASALFLGTAVTRRLGLRLTGFEAPALSVTLGFVLWTWLSFVCALLLPYSFAIPLTIVLSLAVSALLWTTAPAWRWLPWPGGRGSKIAWAIFTALSAGLLGTLMWTHDLIAIGGSLYSANSTWADFGLHAALISHFAAADRLSLDFPVAAGTHLTYPFMIDLLSAWLLRGGWSLHLAIFVPSILLVMAFLQLMLGFGARLFKSLGGAVTALTIMLFSGSAVGAFTAITDYQASGLSLTEFLSHLPQDYTTLNVPNAQFSNLIADILLPQRAFLMGLAMFAAVLILFNQLRRQPTWPLAVFTGGLVGLMPLAHAHTFVVLMALVPAMYIEAWLKHRRLVNPWLAVAGVSLILAMPQIAWQSLANGTGTGGFFSPGWTIQPGESLILFWAHNFGLTGLLIVGLTVAFIAKRPLRRYLVWFAPVAAIFFAANIYSLQPFAYDNLKLMLYTYLMAYLFASYGAIWLIRRSWVASLPLAAAGLLLTSSGTLAVAREFQHQDLFASRDDIELAGWVRQSTHPSDVFLTTDRPNQPVATLGGRSIVSGYRGWLYAYHFDYVPRLSAAQSALNAELTAQNPYHARYLAVSATEPSEWTVNRPALATTYTQVFANASWTVYRLP